MAADPATAVQTGVIISTSAVALITGFLMGLYTTRGYLIPPETSAARHAALYDPEESDEADLDPDEASLDHAPDWRATAASRVRAASPSRAAVRAPGVGATADRPPRPDHNEECKLMLVVRMDLGMNKGKIGAQCGHATLACYKAILLAASRAQSSDSARYLRQWERLGQTKVAVQAKDEAQLIELKAHARSLGIVAEIIADAGHTQVDPGSLTVLGIGPAPKSLIDRVTGHLKLL